MQTFAANTSAALRQEVSEDDTAMAFTVTPAIPLLNGGPATYKVTLTNAEEPPQGTVTIRDLNGERRPRTNMLHRSADRGRHQFDRDLQRFL